MKLVKLIDEDFVNYKKPAMYLGFPTCTFKCDVEAGKRICQNRQLAHSKVVTIETEKVVDRYCKNGITSAVVMGGLEPLDSMEDVEDFILKFRQKSQDDIVVFTGYKMEEEQSQDLISFVKEHGIKNVIVKFGRYVPGCEPHWDDVLGIMLVSDCQKGVEICK